MLSGFINFKKVRPQSSRIDAIREMLRSTWDLSAQFKAKSGALDYEAVKTFNLFFSRLNQIMTQVLKNVVALASLAPSMFIFSREFRDRTGEQKDRISGISRAGKNMAHQIEAVAARTRMISDDSMMVQKEVRTAMDRAGEAGESFSQVKEYVKNLVGASSVLDKNSRSISSIIDTLNKISDETNILSLNARIEAVRSKGDSSGFKVIAEEIAGLAKQSKQATCDIQERLAVLSSKVNETVAAVKMVEETVVSGEDRIVQANRSLDSVHSLFSEFTDNLDSVRESAALQSEAVNTVSRGIVDIEETVNEQARGVETIFEAAEEINRICDAMILDAGIFHLSSHRKVKTEAEELAQNTAVLSFDRSRQETALAGFIDENRFVELAYITDSAGRQVVENIYFEKIGDLDQANKCLGRDWSLKEWFFKPAQNQQTFTSEIYRSSATRSFCFTVSVPLFNGSEFSGVLGIDINFKDIINI